MRSIPKQKRVMGLITIAMDFMTKASLGVAPVFADRESKLVRREHGWIVMLSFQKLNYVIWLTMIVMEKPMKDVPVF
jgi:hypothetical protein